ncbi:MAG: radical SAM protein [Thermodesulfobacteriota bacterium]
MGVDLTPFKTCSFNCVFCQLGRTRQQTIIRKEYVPIDNVLDEIGSWLQTEGNADYVTLSGSGEPTLHTGFGRVLEFLQRKTKIPSVLLTNGSTLDSSSVRESAALADIVKISLSAWDQASFININRPHAALQFSRMVDGQIRFRCQFKGSLWVEVFLLEGMNSTPDSVAQIAAHIQKIKPDRIQLNTVSRPPAENFAVAVPHNHLKALLPLFDPPAEIIAEFRSDHHKTAQAKEAGILSMLQRRPCTMEQILEAFDLHRNETAKYIGKLMQAGLVFSVYKKSNVYYTASHKDNDPDPVNETT